MLTIDEIKNISFRKASIGGYKPEDVDAFIDEVIATVEQLKKEKSEFIRKMDILATKVEQYRSDEEIVRNALLSSQKIADASIKEAKEKAAHILRVADKKAKELISEAEMKVEGQKEQYINLQADAAKLRKEIVLIYKNHLKVVDELPTEADVEKSKKELEEKYPFEPVEDISAEPEKDDIQSAPAAEPEKEKQETAEADSEPKRYGKFDALKFGDNYDVDDE